MRTKMRWGVAVAAFCAIALLGGSGAWAEESPHADLQAGWLDGTGWLLTENGVPATGSQRAGLRARLGLSETKNEQQQNAPHTNAGKGMDRWTVVYRLMVQNRGRGPEVLGSRGPGGHSVAASRGLHHLTHGGRFVNAR